MTLTLQLENVSWFEDGRPTSVTLRSEGCRIGRNASMDWVLPDPEKHISGHHCDIVFDGATYYLVDRSTNGTFIDGQRHRIQGEHPLQDGDRFRVGQYFVAVSLQTAPAAPGLRPMPAPGLPPMRPSALPPLAPPPAASPIGPPYRDGPPAPRELSPTRPVFTDWDRSTAPRPQEEAWPENPAFGSGSLTPEPSGNLQLPPAYGARPAGAVGSDPWDEGSEDLEPVDPLPAPNRLGQTFDAASQDFAPLQRPRSTGDTSGLQLPPSTPPPPRGTSMERALAHRPTFLWPA